VRKTSTPILVLAIDACCSLLSILSAARIISESGVLPERLKKPFHRNSSKSSDCRALKDTCYPVFGVFVVAGIKLGETTLVIQLRAFELGKNTSLK